VGTGRASSIGIGKGFRPPLRDRPHDVPFRGTVFLPLAGLIASTEGSDNAARRDAGQLALTVELCGDRVTIPPAGAANNLALLVARLAGGGLPGSVVGHWAFDRENSPILVNDDQEERPRRFVIMHGTTLAYYATAFIRHDLWHAFHDPTEPARFARRQVVTSETWPLPQQWHEALCGVTLVIC